jgi:putative hydrolase
LAALCKKYGALICIGSDAHYWTEVGNFETALALVTKLGIDAEHIVNSNYKSFCAYCAERRKARKGEVFAG